METVIRIIHAASPQGAELRLVVAAAAVVLAGTRLSKYGDVFSEKLKLGHAFVGLIFMSFATALPELITSSSAAAVEGSPNLALGNNFGSIFFNVSILAWLDILVKEKSLYAAVNRDVMVPGVVSMAMVALGMFFLAVELARPGFIPAPFNVGLGALVIFAAYAGGAGFLRHHDEEHGGAGDEEPAGHSEVSLGWTVVKYAGAALVIGWAGVNLARAGKDLSETYGLSKSFIGTIFLAISTSLPELSATVTMVRRGFYDMAFGNIFGSNAFNVVILAATDVVYRKGSLFADAATEGAGSTGGTGGGHVHMVTGSLAILMTGLVVLGIMHRPSTLRARLSYPSVLVIALFFLGAFVTYLLSM
ncbi:MAG: sodium:calcium antiporter [Planctomycetes bacterium]|nr:sodium:calcium antiporter [Planctomycetota bacterium]